MDAKIIIEIIDNQIDDLNESIEEYKRNKTEQNCFGYAYDIGFRDALVGVINMLLGKKDE